MNTDEKIDLIWERFIAQDDIFARQNWVTQSERYEFRPVKYCPEGCVTYPCEHRTYRTLQRSDILRHLQGRETIGIYSTATDETCKWLCIDIDTLDTSVVLEIAQRVIDRFGNRSLLLEFSGSKGYHIWLFFGHNVPAAQARLLGQVLLGTYSFEVYPRQDGLVGIGNLVKLPLGIQKKTGERCWFLNSSFEKHEDQWDVLKNVRLIDDLGPLPRIEKHSPKVESSLICIENMMNEGLSEGVRDVGLWRLGCYWHRSGIPFDYAMTLAEEVNNRSSPPLSAYDVEAKMQSAYKRDYPKFPCQESGIDQYCSASCYFFESKARSRGLTIAELKEKVRP